MQSNITCKNFFQEYSLQFVGLQKMVSENRIPPHTFCLCYCLPTQIKLLEINTNLDTQIIYNFAKIVKFVSVNRILSDSCSSVLKNS